MPENKLIIVGNGFDLAHGLKTSYKDFLDWYISTSYSRFLEKRPYSDELIKFKDSRFEFGVDLPNDSKTTEDVFEHMRQSNKYSLEYNSHFFNELAQGLRKGIWVDVECFYYKKLKEIFSRSPLGYDKKGALKKLNNEFDFLIRKLGEYMNHINETLPSVSSLAVYESCNFNRVFSSYYLKQIKVLNFNYTDTLIAKEYVESEDNVIYIHGKASDLADNPVVFGYGDETDSLYQQIEDSGDNEYLAHIKSFAYFSKSNYANLISYIDSGYFEVHIVGHSCGLSDRVLLSEIFEHKYCKSIEIYYHRHPDGSDNFKTITQEISRHFKSGNKNLMRRRIKPKDPKNYIPQSGE